MCEGTGRNVGTLLSAGRLTLARRTRRHAATQRAYSVQPEGDPSKQQYLPVPGDIVGLNFLKGLHLGVGGLSLQTEVNFDKSIN